jgi:hypothetical protein
MAIRIELTRVKRKKTAYMQSVVEALSKAWSSGVLHREPLSRLNYLRYARTSQQPDQW